MRGVEPLPPRRAAAPAGLDGCVALACVDRRSRFLSAVAVYGAAQFSRSSFGQSVLHSASNRLLDASAALGLRVADIRVEGRETTDRETILDALGARPGTPILAVDPVRAKQQLESLPWVRSALIERRLPDTLYVRLVER